MATTHPPPRADGPGRRREGAPELDISRLSLDWRRWWTIVPEIVALVCTGLLPLVVGANVVSR